MNNNSSKTIFGQFTLRSTDPFLMGLIRSNQQLQKTGSLLQGCMLRNKMKLYEGNQSYYDDLQIILDYDQTNGPEVFKLFKVPINKEGNKVLVQCVDCGRFTVPFKYCEKCLHIHYCSQACEMRSKYTHLRDCNRRLQPGLDTALQVEIHIGSDLGFNLELYFQHQMRMSLQLRGDQLIKNINEYLNGEAKQMIPENYRADIVSNHLCIKKVDQSKYVKQTSSVTIDSLQSLTQLYTKNQFIPLLQRYLTSRGGILWKYITQIHNNHLHLIYVFLCC